MDLVNMLVGLLGLGLAAWALIRDGRTVKRMEGLEERIEREYAVRKIIESLDALVAVGHTDFPASSPPNQHELRRFDVRWIHEAGRLTGSLGGANNPARHVAVESLQQMMSSTSSHLALVREANYMVDTTEGVWNSVLDTLGAAAALRAELDRRGTR